MKPPASTPDTLPPRAEPQPGSDEASEGSNATTHQPDPRADRRPQGEGEGGGSRTPRRPYSTGND